MTRSVRWLCILLGALALGSVVACGGGDEGGESGGSGSPGTDGTEATTEVATVVSREDVFACLEDAGLAPENSGAFIVGSEGTEVEAIGVRLDAGIVQVWVFDDADSASAQVEAWAAATGPGAVTPAASTALGNVALAYESEPTPAERAPIEACLPAA